MAGLSLTELENLQRARAEIDGIDSAIVSLLAQRWKLAAETFVVKRRHHLPLQDLAREKQVLDHVTCAAHELGLPAEHVQKIYEVILRYSLQHQAGLKA